MIEAPHRTGTDPGRRVVLVDDHPLLTLGLRAGLEQRGVDVLVPDVSDRDRLLTAIGEFGPGLVVLDFGLPSVGDGASLVGPIRALGAGVLMLSGSEDRIGLARCLEAGASGVISKDEDVDVILAAVERWFDGEQVAVGRSSRLRDELRAAETAKAERLEPFEALSRREAVVLGHLLTGLSAAEIAAAEYVSLPTVRTQIRAVLSKLEVHSQLEAVALAHDAGWSAPSS